MSNPTSQTLTITNDDAAPTVSLALSPSSISENGGTSTVTATLSTASGETVTVTVTAVAVDPASSADFELSSNLTLAIAAGETASTGTVTVTAVDNDIDAPDKTVTVSATASGGGVSDPTSQTLTITDDEEAPTGSLVNISTRAVVGTGDEVLIGGFIIRNGPKRVLVQAQGPELANFNIANALTDPVLTVIDSEGKELIMNDNWGDSQGQVVIDAWGGSPNLAVGSASAAVIIELDPGDYNAKVEGKDGTTGVALVEVYDLDSADVDGRLVNISTRAVVGTGDEVMIGGFIIRNGPKRVLVQAQGPELANFNIANALADPVLTVIDSEGKELIMNDNWGDSQGQVVIDAWGGSPNLAVGSASAAVILELDPGDYNAKVEGKNGTTGVALVEVYDLD